MALNIDIDNVTLDILSARLKNVVSPLDILKWLGNFKKNELKYAIDILSNLTVYTTNEIEEILNDSFNSLFEKLEKDDRIIVHPIGDFGKSGSLITYFFQKTAFYKNRNNQSKIKLLPTLNNFETQTGLKYTLVLLDDFIGSGKTLKTFYDESIKDVRHNFDKLYFVGIAGMSLGIKTITPLFDNIKIPPSNLFRKIFSSDGSFFGYRKHYRHREFCYEYGKILTSPTNKKTEHIKYNNALGFENSQALVSFAYGSPNNTLPIIWANKNGWIPLIPRFSIDKISVAKMFRKNISHELAILKEFGSTKIQDNFFSYKIKKGKKTFTSVNKIDFSIYSIIKLTRAGFVPVSICQKLGILYKDYEEIIEQGKKRGIFETDNQLTLFGLELYSDAKKCIESSKKSFEYESVDHYPIKQLNYLPEKFNGRS